MYRRAQTGFTLTEVLTSVFLLALGIVGAAGMQLQALRTAQQSAFRTAALSLASEMADMMRMTLIAPNAQAHLKPYLQLDFHAKEHSAGTTGDCYSSLCTTEQLVEFNIEQWKRRIASSLPDARVKVCVDAATWNHDAEEPNWDCRPLASYMGNGSIVVKIGWQDKTQTTSNDMRREEPKGSPPILVLNVAPYVQ